MEQEDCPETRIISHIHARLIWVAGPSPFIRVKASLQFSGRETGK
jgi:hypothetical protein